MSRRGSSLLECLLWLAGALPVIAAAWGIVIALMRQGQPPDGTLADLACDRLRRDAAAGAVVEGDRLRLGRHAWHVAAGFLERDGTQRLRVVAARWEAADGAVTVRLEPVGLPPRVLELGR